MKTFAFLMIIAAALTLSAAIALHKHMVTYEIRSIKNTNSRNF